MDLAAGTAWRRCRRTSSPISPPSRWLHLDNSKLETLPEGIFSGLGTLRVLYLGPNRLTSLPEGLFTGLAALKTLYLDNNRPDELACGRIRRSPRPRELLYLDNNRAGAPCQRAIFDRPRGAAESAFVSGNRLTSLARGHLLRSHGCCKNSCICDNNRLAHFARGRVLRSCRSLQILYLQNNRLTRSARGRIRASCRPGGAATGRQPRQRGFSADRRCGCRSGLRGGSGRHSQGRDRRRLSPDRLLGEQCRPGLDADRRQRRQGGADRGPHGHGQFCHACRYDRP